MSTTKSPLVDDYLRRLRAALAGLPADRRQDIIEGVGQHIAEARLQPGQDSDEAIRSILGQLGDPDVIAADALEAEPGSLTAAGPPPPPVRYAVWLMYGGAAVSLAAAIADIATKNELREVIARTPISRNLIGTATTATFVMAAAVNLAAVLLWLLMARWNGKGSITVDPGMRAVRPSHGGRGHRAGGTVREQPVADGRAGADGSRLAGRPGRDRVLVAATLDAETNPTPACPPHAPAQHPWQDSPFTEGVSMPAPTA